jgi:hypothetical protein
LSCSSKEVAQEMEEEEVEIIINCTNTSISISEQDNIVINHATNPVVWVGTYNDNTVKIKYTKSAGVDNETETLVFIFNKVNSCLQLERGFKFYDGKEVDVSAITEIDVSEFYTKEWEIDKKFSGIVTYLDPHDKNTYSRKFWVEFTNQNFEVEDTNYSLFNNCFTDKLPVEIDLNKDEIVDFKITYELTRDIGNRPKYNKYNIKLISTNETENQILSPTKGQSPYFVIFEAPFTSEGTRQYFNGVKSDLDVFYEFDAPYQSYNYFLHNNLTNKATLENNKEDYYIVKMGLDNKEYYGWIKFKFNSTNCDVEVLDTFLNPTASEHVSVN